MASEHHITKPVADPGNTVNEAVVQRQFTFLSGEISYPVQHKGLSGRQRLVRGYEKSAEGIVVAPACNGPDMMKA